MNLLPSEAQIGLLLFLLVLFALKHWVADYIAQTQYMLRKGQATGWTLPLLCHSAAHGVLTFLILLAPVSVRVAFSLALLDLCIHFVVDYWKAQVNKSPFGSKAFWIALGFDQMLHNLTYIGLAYMAVHFA